MNAADFIDYCKGKTQEELNGIIVQSFWEVDMVDEAMTEKDIPLDEFTYDEKCALLERACETDGDNEAVHYAIEDEVDALHEEKSNA